MITSPFMNKVRHMILFILIPSKIGIVYVFVIL